MSVIFSKASFPYVDGTTLLANEAEWSYEFYNPINSLGTAIINNRVRQVGTGDAWIKNSAIPADADQTVFADLYCASVLTNDAVGLLARMTGLENHTAIFGGIRRTSTAFEVRAFHFVNTVTTQIGTTVTVPFSAGETKRLQLEVSGQSPNISVVLKFDGTTHISQTINVAALDAKGLLGLRLSSTAALSDTTGMHLTAITASDSVASDTTAPILTLPTGTTTGPTTASGTVTTDEANGTLYAAVTASATPPSAEDIRLGTGAAYATSQTVTAVGVQNVAAPGLTASTAYYWHYLHDDAASNASNIVTSASFTTDAVPGIAVTDPLKNNTGTPRANETGVSVAVLQAADLVSVYEATGLTTDASGLLEQVSDVSIVAATSYYVVIKLSDGSVGITGPIAAA